MRVVFLYDHFSVQHDTTSTEIVRHPGLHAIALRLMSYFEHEQALHFLVQMTLVSHFSIPMSQL